MAEQFQGLLPIGERVTHFGGGPDTHGKGTIVAYNGRQPSGYLNERFSEATEIAAKTGMLGGLVESFYDGVRCPYVIRWDSSDQYPQGYRDVYEQASINRLEPAENIFEKTGFASIENAILARRWCSGDRAWTDWQVMSSELYEQYKDDRSFEICRREGKGDSSSAKMSPHQSVHSHVGSGKLIGDYKLGGYSVCLTCNETENVFYVSATEQETPSSDITNCLVYEGDSLAVAKVMFEDRIKELSNKIDQARVSQSMYWKVLHATDPGKHGEESTF